eukprot:PhF_6_TR31867/c0_g1_i3/m.47291
MSELESLRAEYEAFQNRTKDWQAKVRERDVVMKQRITESTQIIKEKDQQLEEKCNEIGSLVQQKNSLQEYVSKLEEKVMKLEESVSTIKSDEKRTTHLQEQVEQKYEEIKTLREKVLTLESSLQKAKSIAEGLDIGELTKDAFQLLATVKTNENNKLWCCINIAANPPQCRWVEHSQIASHYPNPSTTLVTEYDRGVKAQRQAAMAELVMVHEVYATKVNLMDALQQHVVAGYSTLLKESIQSVRSEEAKLRKTLERKMGELEGQAKMKAEKS